MASNQARTYLVVSLATMGLKLAGFGPLALMLRCGLVAHRYSKMKSLPQGA